VLLSQASPVLHQNPVPDPGQHGCPIAPHATHSPLEHVENGAVHPPPAQQGAPTTPHAPPLQPPAEQLPSPAPQEFPCATHDPDTQQAPELHSSPSQQGWPAPPQPVHWPVRPHV
jgi:hypothetical protein